MVHFTYNEGILADTLLLAARATLAEAEQVAKGALVRVTVYSEDGDPFTKVLPYRVAAYARRELGNGALLNEGYKVAFTGRGVTVAVEPGEAAYISFVRVLLSHNEAQLRRNKRLAAKYRALIKKGGAAL